MLTYTKEIVAADRMRTLMDEARRERLARAGRRQGPERMPIRARLTVAIARRLSGRAHAT
jgi:hypothetical protein